MSGSHTSQDDADFSSLNKFRINNMMNLKIISSHNNKISYKDRFESGYLTNHTATLPFFGNTLLLVIDFYWDPVYVLDRFPNSKIIKENDDGSFRIEIYANDGYGVKMWLLSQGDMVKVISPQKIKDYIIQDMIHALKYYDYDI
nr:WYL domain-containing protein [Vagococcus elongatus]